MKLVGHYSRVIVEDGVEAVCDGDDSAVGKLGADCLLDEVISLQVDSSRSLVQYQDLGLAQQGPSEAHQLTLANTSENRIKEEAHNLKVELTETELTIHVVHVRQWKLDAAT